MGALDQPNAVRKENLMKVVPVMGILAGCVGLLALGGSPARAQSEVAPDHFESSNVEPFKKPKTTASSEAAIRYDGQFTLPYTVECIGKSLPPGRYSVSLHSDGKIGQATLKQRGRAIGIPGVVYKQTQKNGSDALVVELSGKTRKLTAIQVAELVFEPKPPMEGSSGSKPKRFEKLLLTETSQRN
jgi:hypothetical protein